MCFHGPNLLFIFIWLNERQNKCLDFISTSPFTCPSLQLVNPNIAYHENNGHPDNQKPDPRSLMTLVDIPSRHHGNGLHRNSPSPANLNGSFHHHSMAPSHTIGYGLVAWHNTPFWSQVENRMAYRIGPVCTYVHSYVRNGKSQN